MTWQGISADMFWLDEAQLLDDARTYEALRQRERDEDSGFTLHEAADEPDRSTDRD